MENDSYVRVSHDACELMIKRYAALEDGAGDRERAEAYASEVCDE